MNTRVTMSMIYKYVIIAIACLYISPLTARTTVLSSIKPIDLIVQEITSGTDTKHEILIPNNASAHHYQLKPSDALMLKDADVFFWVGEEIETFMPKALSIRNKQSRALLTINELHLLQLNEHEGHEHVGGIDGHIWLSLDNASIMSHVISSDLAKYDPSNAEIYLQNARNFQQKLNTLEIGLKNKFQSIENKNIYIVAHDAYSYFEEILHIKHVDKIYLSPDATPGMSHLSTLTTQVKNDVCLLIEPTTSKKMVQFLQTKSTARMKIISVDPLAGDADTYLSFIQSIADKFAYCVGGM